MGANGEQRLKKKPRKILKLKPSTMEVDKEEKLQLAITNRLNNYKAKINFD